MFTGGFEEIAFILFIAFLLFGPKKLPEIARLLGKGLGDLRRASSELRFSLEDEIRNLDRSEAAAGEPKAFGPLEELRHTSRELMTTLEDEIKNLGRSESRDKPDRLDSRQSLESASNGDAGPPGTTYVHHDSEPAPPKRGS